MMNHHFEYFFHKYLTSRIRRKEGDYIWIESMMQPMEDEIYSEEKLILCISRDITARKIAEKQVNDVVERYRRLVEHSHDTIGIISNSGTLTYINETGKKLFGRRVQLTSSEKLSLNLHQKKNIIRLNFL